ncbi:MAG: ribosome maturation factor RimM [Elainellaceae cyanobacterium]
MTSTELGDHSTGLSADPSSTADSDWLEIGRIVSPQGLQGELRVYPSSDFPERFLSPGTRWLQHCLDGPNGLSSQTDPAPVELLTGRLIPKKGLYVIRLAGIDSRDAAESLRNARLFVPSSDRPLLEDGEYHVSDLIGLSVYDRETGDFMGTVVDLREAGNDILEVAMPSLGPDGDMADSPRTVLIPFVEPIVPIVDITQGRIEITPPPGLLDL